VRAGNWSRSVVSSFHCYLDHTPSAKGSRRDVVVLAAVTVVAFVVTFERDLAA